MQNENHEDDFGKDGYDMIDLPVVGHGEKDAEYIEWKQRNDDFLDDHFDESSKVGKHAAHGRQSCIGDGEPAHEGEDQPAHNVE